jgi:hypothetical protein
MSEEESGQDIALIGLGGAGIKTMLALRALIEKEILSAHGSRENSCQLIAIDSNPFAQDYFHELDDRDHDDLLLAQNEYLGLLKQSMNPWDIVTKDAKSNIPEALKLNSQRPVIEISRSPDRSDSSSGTSFRPRSDRQGPHASSAAWST